MGEFVLAETKVRNNITLYLSMVWLIKVGTCKNCVYVMMGGSSDRTYNLICRKSLVECCFIYFFTELLKVVTCLHLQQDDSISVTCNHISRDPFLYILVAIWKVIPISHAASLFTSPTYVMMVQRLFLHLIKFLEHENYKEWNAILRIYL